MKKLPNPLLYLVLTPELCSQDPLETARQALQAGVQMIQLRSKVMTDRELFTLGNQLRGLSREYDTLFIMNDRIDLAKALDADGVHLGQNDLPPKLARELLGCDKLIGLSCHNLKQLEEASKLDTDYCGIGPLFPTTTKENPDPVVSHDLLKQLTGFPKTLVGIGGITTGNVDQIVHAGLQRVAVVTAITKSQDIAKTVKQFFLKLKGN